MSSSPIRTLDAEVCVLGAGPHGLAVAAALAAASPSLARQLVVLDPAGSWLGAWHDAFARLEIEHLRSPLVHHPDVRPGALDRHIRHHGLPRSGLPYDPPTTTAFASFCRELERRRRLAPPVAVSCRRLQPSRRGLTVDAGRVRIDARRVVLATNPHRRVIPSWTGLLLGHEPDLVTHAADVDLRRTEDLADRRVLVVGGGLTAAHLASGAARRGASVTLLTRRPLEVRAFDTEPGWLGPKRLSGFEAEPDPSARLAAVRAARGGGTIPAWMRERLAHLESDDRLRIVEARHVISPSGPPGGSRAPSPASTRRPTRRGPPHHRPPAGVRRRSRSTRPARRRRP